MSTDGSPGGEIHSAQQSQARLSGPRQGRTGHKQAQPAEPEPSDALNKPAFTTEPVPALSIQTC